MKKRIIATALVAIMVAIGFAGCGAPAGQPSGSAATSGDTIKIGGLAPLTGDVSIYGIATNNGIKLAFDEINAKGGILGKQIEYIPYDEKGDATEAVNAYNKLVQNDKVVAIVGDVTSTPTIAVAQKAAEDNMPIITATGTSDIITTKGENVFRACFMDSFQGQLMASYASEKLGAKTAAILYSNSNDYSTGLKDSFVETAATCGLEIVAQEAYADGDVDFKSQLTNIAAKNPDVLFLPEYYQDIALIAPQSKEVGLKATLLGADGWDGVIAQVGADNAASVEGAIFCNHYSAENPSEALASFIKKYKDTYGEEPNSFAALGYDAAYMLAKAIEDAGSTDSAAIIAAMSGMEFEGVTGNIKLDENRNAIKQAAINKIESGAYKFVEFYQLAD